MQASCQPPDGRLPRRASAVSRAATRADRLPIVPPDTKQPPAVRGQPSSSTNQPNASFSAKIAPAPVSQTPPNTLAALVTKSNATDARVGADGT